MSSEFYNYIAKNTLNFFQNKEDNIRPGERYCLKLDTDEMVSGVDHALRALCDNNGILGNYLYEDVYETYTIKLSLDVEVVVASKINGMTDDFLATLRNAELTSKHYPILMITSSAIDTIISGTGDLSASGMPFHASSIINKIKDDIQKAQLSIHDKVLLEEELKRKQSDRFSDKSSLYEYAELLTVLGRGYLQENDYGGFALLYDPEGMPLQDEKKIKARLEDNHECFEKIDRIFKHGNIEDELGTTYDKGFLSHLQDCKKKSRPWYSGYTYEKVKESRDKLQRKLNNPLQIEDENITAYSGMPLDYMFASNVNFFIRNDAETKAKRRNKNILIYNSDNKTTVTIDIRTNITVKSSWINETTGCSINIIGKEVYITVTSSGCAFARVKIKDPNNNITFTIKICLLDIAPKYFENIRTCYVLNVSKSLNKSAIKVFGVTKDLIINPGCEETDEERAVNNKTYDCRYDRSLKILFGEEEIDTDTGHLDCCFKIGNIIVPLQIQDEATPPIVLTGVGAFKRKHLERKSFEYIGGRIIAGTREYFAKEPFKTILKTEEILVQNGWLAVEKTPDGYCEYPIEVSQKIRDAFDTLVQLYRSKRSLPSLFYYDDKGRSIAENYVRSVQEEFAEIKSGSSLTSAQSQLLLLGCVIKRYDDCTIEMSPLQPLNIQYQLRLLEETAVGDVRDNLVEKLTPLYLLPYIKNPDKHLYHAVEQKYAPEWRFYAPISNQRFQGARNFVAKLVCDKILQYKEHFSFLFDDIDNKCFCINLVNMGDCREVLQGLLRYYELCLHDEKMDPDDLMCFVVNIYSDLRTYNEFALLSDQGRFRAYIKDLYNNEDASELLLIATSKIRCYYRNSNDSEYQYAHLTFYEMTSSEDTGASHMDSITTGIALDGLTSGTPSVLNADWYKTGFGMKYARLSQLNRLAAYYNALFRVAFSGSAYESSSCIFTEIEQGQEGQLGKIYKSSNWVVFVDPKVDLSFFKNKSEQDDELMIIHYSDQYTSASGYDDITVTQKSSQYNEIISEQLQKKGVSADISNVDGIIDLFNAVNGGWMLRLITAKKLSGAADSYFSREKMSILSAIKLCMAYYSHNDIVWIPVSLEEMLRVSGGAGLSQNEGLLSAKNLGFEQRATSDDILLVGVEGPNEQIKIYLHPVEVKIGQNPPAVLNKAYQQVLNTYNGLWNALWPEEGRDDLERKLSRNFFIQLLIVCCEKMKLYGIYPDVHWDDVLEAYRENLLNEQYEFSTGMDSYIGKGTIVSFASEVLNKRGTLENDVCLLEFPEKLGSEYMVLSPAQIERQLDAEQKDLPERLKFKYQSVQNTQEETLVGNVPYSYSNVITEVQQPVPVAVEPLNEYSASDNVAPEEINTSAPVPGEQERLSEAHREGMHVLFGTDEGSGNPLYWLPNDTNQLFHTNTGIIGTMGTGKTQFTKSLIAQLYRDQNHNIGNDPLGILIFDYKGDYNESKEDFIQATQAKVLKPYHLPFNPLALTKSKVFKPLLPIHTANAFKDTLSKVYNLGPKQQNTLFQCIIDAYAARGISAPNPDTWNNTPPTFDMVYSLYSNDEEIKKNDSLAAAMDKLYQFQIFEGNPKETVSLFELLKGVVVIDLSGYDADIQSLIVAITLDLFYSQMQASGSSRLKEQYRQMTKLILVDEADNFMSEGFPALKKIMKEGREFGVGTILSTQFLKHFGTGDDDYSKYILTWVVHNVADLKNSDVEFVFKTEVKSQEGQILYNDIKKLQKHHSIVKIGNSKPKYIRDKAFWELYQEIRT